jgi:hypothetical protein
MVVAESSLSLLLSIIGFNAVVVVAVVTAVSALAGVTAASAWAGLAVVVVVVVAVVLVVVLAVAWWMVGEVGGEDDEEDTITLFIMEFSSSDKNDLLLPQQPNQSDMREVIMVHRFTCVCMREKREIPIRYVSYVCISKFQKNSVCFVCVSVGDGYMNCCLTHNNL